MYSEADKLHTENRGTCLVVGAGIAGLMAARILNEAGFRVKVFDKGRGVGGRMATRRFGGGVFDHGAQFITVRDSKFQSMIEKWQRSGIVDVWADGFFSDKKDRTGKGHPRYRGIPGMTAIPKALAIDIDIRLSMRIHSVSVQDGRWHAAADGGELFFGDALIMTPPVPQSLELLEHGKVELPRQLDERLRRIAYHPCIALLAVFDEPTRIPSPGGLQFERGNIRWMADNQQKGISPAAVAVTLHASPEFSRQHWDSADEAIAARLLAESAEWLPGSATSFQVHRWRYSQPVDTVPVPDFFTPGPPPVAFAGDAFAGGRVEGAAISGRKAAEWLTTAG